MIVVIGYLRISPGSRARLLEESVESVGQARAAQGCLHFACTADSVEEGLVCVAELWNSRAELEAFRGNGPSAQLEALIESYDVREIDMGGEAGEAALHELLAERAHAVAKADLSALTGRLAERVHQFPVIGEDVSRGRAALSEGTRAWLDGYRSRIGYDVHDLEVTSSGDLAACWYRYRITGTLTSGDEIDMWVRATIVIRRFDGEWLIVHAHESQVKSLDQISA